MKKSVYVVTHGDKFNGPNPGMTPKGHEEIFGLRWLIPEEPSAIVCGTGRRHLDTAYTLELRPTRFTCLAGDPDSLEIIHGQKMFVLANGETFPLSAELYTSLSDMTPAAQAMVIDLPDNAVICGGRPAMIMLGFPQAKSAGVYRVTVDDGKIVAIDEVQVDGVIDPALQG